MGCKFSAAPKQSGQEENVRRRRLSISDLEPVLPDEACLFTALCQEDIMELLACDARCNMLIRRFSMTSQTDYNTESFAKKCSALSVHDGGNFDSIEIDSIGIECRKGLKPESPNQDSWCVLRLNDQFNLYAVFDGHGRDGHHVSDFVKEFVPKLILRDERFPNGELKQLLIDVFVQTQAIVETADSWRKLQAKNSGTTVTVVLHDNENHKLWVAHCGDSSAVLGHRAADQSYKATAITRDHKPNLPDERKRIENAGGVVLFDGFVNYRVFMKNQRRPGLNLSRCLDDLTGHQKCGLSCIPEVAEHNIQRDDMLLICSDGVWEFMTPDEAVEFVMCNHSFKTAQEAADIVAKEAWDRWIREDGQVVDDITVLVVFLSNFADADCDTYSF
eukprot:NODE_5386_length_1776_cov_6.382656.p1 GENE.NODE_5386_length_1776_cov_6.382656~~NODE_5386_length_1776_cov_6.382656.p1  ORF type:complete len:389 (-),score=61.56 NODE_5386_length_1776_cov_6.382656:536-1702(-)